MRNSELMNVVVIGAGGILSPELFPLLLDKGIYKVYALCRQGSDPVVPSGVEILRSDFSYPSLLDVFRGKQLVVDTVARMAVPDRTRLYDAIVDAGVVRLIPGEFTSNMENPAMVALWEMHGDRVAIREYLRQKASKKPSFSWTVVAVGPFYDWALKVGFMRYDLDKKTATIFDDGLKPFCATTLEKSCDVVHGIFTHLGETENKILYVSSFTINQNEVLDALQKATGTVWTVHHKTTEAEIEGGRRKLANGDPMGQMELLLAAIYAPQFGSDWSDAAKENDAILGLEPEDLYLVTQEIVDGKRPKQGAVLGLLGRIPED